MAANSYNAGMGSIFIQFAPNTEVYWLGCHTIEDISEGRGEKTLQYCKDPSGAGRFQVAGSYRGAPEPPTITIEALLGSTADYLEQIGDGQVTIFVNKHSSGVANLFSNWKRRSILINAETTQKTEAGVANRDPSTTADSLFTVEMQADVWITVYPLGVTRQSTSEANAVNSIAWMDHEVGYAVTDAGAGVTANVLYTEDGGGTWTATATDPFAADEDIRSVVVFPMGEDVHRVLCAREGDAGAALEVAYSDDEGATWTLVTVGATNAQAAGAGRGLFALDWTHIWVVTNGGYVYFSDDGGATWETQDAGVATTANLNGVHFINALDGMAYGAAGKVITTSDGGNTWTLVTTVGADALLAGFMIDEDHLWVGNDKSALAGTLYYSHDAGVTWNLRSFTGGSAGEVKSISFINDRVGVIAHNNATPNGKLLATYDGGQNWEPITVTTTAAINDLLMINANTFFAGGEVQTTALLLKGGNDLSPRVLN